MEVDWGQALEIGGLGFLLVFVVLFILAFSMRVLNLLITKYGPKEGEETNSNQNGAR